MSKMPGDRAWDAADRHRRAADALRARLAAAEAREARLVGALRETVEAHAEMESTRGMAAKQRWERARTAASAALTTDGSALAQAIEGVLDAAQPPPVTRLDRACEALRRAWGQR